MKIIAILCGIILFLPSALALIPDSVGNLFTERLPQGIINGDTFAVFFFKFILWVIVFAAMYAAIAKVHENKRTALIIALAMSLAGVALIPSGTITGIFTLYAGIFSILIIILPLLLLWYFNREVLGKSAAGWSKALIYIFVSAVLIFFALPMQQGSGIYADFGEWLEIGAVVLFFAGLIAFFEN